MLMTNNYWDLFIKWPGKVTKPLTSFNRKSDAELCKQGIEKMGATVHIVSLYEEE